MCVFVCVCVCVSEREREREREEERAQEAVKQGTGPELRGVRARGSGLPSLAACI